MDQAAYHTSKYMAEVIEKLRVPCYLSSPHSPSLAPVEKIWNHLKQGDLNPDNKKLNKQ